LNFLYCIVLYVYSYVYVRTWHMHLLLTLAPYVARIPHAHVVMVVLINAYSFESKQSLV
jgi:hypothetical protein